MSHQRPFQARPDLPCLAAGCDQPRRAYPSGRVVTRCRRHELERVRLIKSRPVLDPDTGETFASGALYQRDYRIRRQAVQEIRP